MMDKITLYYCSHLDYLLAVLMQRYHSINTNVY